ncbi:MAG: hypothetical protein ACR2OE_04125 [Thermomicrobiales bacterium]
MIVTDPETGEVIDLAAVQKLIHRCQAAHTDHLRNAVTTQLLDSGAALDRAQKELEKRIDAGYRRLPMNRETQVFTDKEESQELIWMGWLKSYEDISDTLYAIEQGVLLGHWNRVNARHKQGVA